MTRLILYLTICISFSNAYCQQISFDKISDKDGLVNSNVTSILKDHRGYMWFGTYYGLSKYDGYSFANYMYDRNDHNSIAGNQIRCLYETKNSTLIIGFQYDGLCIYNRELDNFIRLSHSDKDSTSLAHNYVLSIFEDSKNRIWIGTRNGLDLLDLKSKTFKHFHPFKRHEMPFVTSIAEGKDGKLWLYGVGSEICQFDADNINFTYFKFKEYTTNDNSYNTGGYIMFDTKGALWICNGYEGIFVYDISKHTCIKKFNTQNGLLKHDIVMCVKQISDGTIWIGTDGAGIYIYNPRLDKLTQLKHDDMIPNSLAGNGVYAIEEYSDKIVWVGSYASGISKWVQTKNKFKGFHAKGLPNKRLNHKSVLAVAESKEGIWLGTDGGGLNLFDPETETIKPYTLENSKIGFDVIKSISTTSEGNLWLGSYQKGLCLWDTKNKKVIKKYIPAATVSEKSIAGDKIWALSYSEQKNKLYIGLLTKGLDVLNTSNNTFIHEKIDEHASKKLSSASVFAIHEDKKGKIWIITQTLGAVYYDPDTRKEIKFTSETSKNRSLPSNEIRDVFEDSRGQIWFATIYGGLCKMIDFKTKNFQSFSIDHGLNTTNVLCILEDHHCNLWVSTDKGISKFDTRNETFENFSTEDGLLCKEYNINCKLNRNDGTLLFGGIDGFNYFNPDSIRQNKNKPNIALTKLYILNELILPNKKNTILKKSIDLSSKIELEYSDNIIQLEFSALEYISPNKNQYSYFLEGFDSKWYSVGADRRVATYTNLNPGIYTFKIKASNNDGVWGKIKTLQIIVNPPWYMTWWFRLCLVALFLSLIGGYYYHKISNIKKLNQYLEDEVKKRTSVIEQQQKVKDKFYSIVAHDLRNPVSALSILSEMLSTEMKHTANKSQSDLIKNIEISSNRLKNLVINLLDWTRSHSTKIELDKAEVNVSDLVTENIELQKAHATLKNIQITFEISKGQKIFIDLKMIDTVIRNILSNAIKFTPNGGTIKFSTFSKNETTITIRIQDSGIGMSEETLNKLFTNITNATSKGTNNEQGTGLGLTIVKEFVELNNGRLEIKSQLGQGTSFYIDLPGKTESEHENASLIKNEKYQSDKTEFELEGVRILLVDDNSFNIIFVSKLLEKWGATTDTATDGLEAIDKVTANDYDLVLMDIHMPNMNGFEATEKIRQMPELKYKNLVIFALTAENLTEVSERAMQNGFNDIISKPFNPAQLLQKITNYTSANQ